jgi:O-antigen/teichoic acid export membrane protein
MSETVHFSLKSAVKGTSFVFFGMVSSVLFWFFSKILIIRYTSKEEFGLYSLAVAIVGIFSIIATLGLQEGIARYVSIFIGEGKQDKATAMTSASLVAGLLSGLCFFGVLFFSSGILSDYIFYKTDLRLPLQVLSFFIPLSVMAVIMSGILRGHNMFIPKIYADVGQPFFFLVFLGIFFLLRLPFISIIYAYVLSMAAVFVFIGYYLIKKVKLLEVPFRVWEGQKELLRFSLPVLVVSVLGVVLGWTDTLMLGRYASAADVGIYNVGISLAKLLSFPLNAIAFVLMPLAGEMFARKQNAELGRTYQILTKWIFSATFPMFFVLFFFPEMTITFLFGERFVDAAVSLRILAFCFLFHSFMGANGILLLVMGLSKTLMNVSIFGIALNVGLNYLLIKRLGYGVIGAAVSTLISYIALNVLISSVLYKRSGIHPLTVKYIKPIIGASIIGVILYALAKNLALYLWMLPLYFLLFIFGYALSIILTRSIDEEDAFLFKLVMDKLGVSGPMTASLMKFISRT